MTTITHTTGVITPTIVDGWQASREARSIVHTILGLTAPDVTLRPAGMRRGTLRCVFSGEGDARAAELVFGVPQVLTLQDDDRTTLNMSFVIADGDIDLELDDTTRDVWILTAPFQEVAP